MISNKGLFTIGLIGGLAFTLLDGCSQPTEKEKFKDKMKDKLDEINNRLETLDKDLARKSGEAKEFLKEKIRALKGERTDLERKIDQIEDKSEKIWQHFKNEMEDLVDKINNDLEDIKQN